MKHAFVLSANDSYIFGLNATMNAMKYFGTNADFFIAYWNIPEDYRKRCENAFPFKVTWIPMLDILACRNVTAKVAPCQYWVVPWVLGSQIIDDYDSICITQADEFLCANVNNYFRVAALADMVIATEYTSTWIEFEDLPFGTDKSIWNRCQYALYDQLVFLNKKYKQILIDTARQQEVDGWKDEAQHPMCALNQACAKYLTRDNVIGLDAHLWAWDMDTCEFKLHFDHNTNKVWNERKCRVMGIHNRWWWQGRGETELKFQKSKGDAGKLNYEIGRENYNNIRAFMAKFNDMTPETKWTQYYKDPII